MIQIPVGEAERIKRCKGRVFALQDEPEVPRVWLPFDDAPGLAMARAFGDFCLKEYGVISIPEFCHRVLTERDQFIVLASDGVNASFCDSCICSFPFPFYFPNFCLNSASFQFVKSMGKGKPMPYAGSLYDKN